MSMASLLLAFVAGQPAGTEVEDYLMVFAADSAHYRPTRAHTFAALARVARAPGGPPCLVELVSLSWLPATGKVRAFALRCETGRNVPLDETLQTYLDSGSCVCMWGPYRVCPDLAETFKARVATVESQFKYRAACVFSRRQVCDCARSVDEMLGHRRRYIGVFGYGAAAASVIVRRCSPGLVEPEQSHPWVATLIGLDSYPLVCRSFGDYTSRWDQAGVWLRGR
jgi:hypothetical protein